MNVFFTQFFWWFSVEIPKTSVTAEPTYSEHLKLWHHGDNITLQCNPATTKSSYDFIFVWQILYKSYAGQTRKTKTVERSDNNKYLITSVEEYADGADYTCEILIQTPVRNETTNASDNFTVTIYRKWFTLFQVRLTYISSLKLKGLVKYFILIILIGEGTRILHKDAF